MRMRGGASESVREGSSSPRARWIRLLVHGRAFACRALRNGANSGEDPEELPHNRQLSGSPSLHPARVRPRNDPSSFSSAYTAPSTRASSH